MGEQAKNLLFRFWKNKCCGYYSYINRAYNGRENAILSLKGQNNASSQKLRFWNAKSAAFAILHEIPEKFDR